jgi:protein-tyrosine-phosphatase
MKKVLFVCVENSCRSQMAEAFARVHGEDIVEAYSSGSNPSGIVNEKAVAAMKEIGYDLSSHTSKSLSEIPDVEYEYAVTMGCGDECPFVKARHREDWQIPDPKDMEEGELRRVRGMIEDEVRTLLNKIKSP